MKVCSNYNWLARQPETRNLKVGYFGSNTGAAAALIAALRLGTAKAIITRRGRPDLADESILNKVKLSTLFIVAGKDPSVIAMNKRTPVEDFFNMEQSSAICS